VGHVRTAAFTGLAAVVVAGTVAAIPPAARPAAATWKAHRSAVAGAFHVHTDRSDGSGSVDDVAAAAARAGLHFVLLTDHGDGMRRNAAPEYRSGVLMIDGVEISTTGGHYAAFDMPPSPYPLGGDAQDVVEDVARLGGFGVAAHADSPKRDLRWKGRVDGVDAVEWLNLDTVWRRATRSQVARASVAYWFRPPEALALAMTPTAATFDWIDAIARERRVVAFAAADAHGTFVSSYEPCFKTMTTRVELAAPLRGHALEDARSIAAALRAGHHYSVVDGLAQHGGFEFIARTRDGTVGQGDELPAGTAATLEARIAASHGSSLLLLRNGAIVRRTASNTLTYETDGMPGTYRVEARIDDVPWVVSNSIFVGLPAPGSGEEPRAARTLDLINGAGRVWHAERDARSAAALVRERGAITLRFGLRPGEARDQFAAIVLPVPPDFVSFDRLRLTARATHPLRLSVQLRELGNDNPPRWRRSIYLDRSPRTHTVRFDEMVPVAPNDVARVPRALVGGLLLLVDTTHARPGDAGEIEVSALAFER
jgi:hypothetical protein